eukprot:TRINITY_DN7850_c0_g1_i1.p1 TRINITY_DN7850_c0_g1~~TRINITY_DN7850_c0_g1_i1.p1  ORF type:complete len:133 (-),score=23.21 TRINITY_DN7850_c0_g1_i1:47-445(-)
MSVATQQTSKVSQSLAEAFLETVEGPLKTSIYERLDDLEKEQEMCLDKFTGIQCGLDGLNVDLQDIAQVYAKIPEYTAKIELLKEEMSKLAETTKQLQQRASEVKKFKEKQLKTDAQLMAHVAEEAKSRSKK